MVALVVALALFLTACSGEPPAQPEASATARPDGAPEPFPAIGDGVLEGEVGADGLDLEDVDAEVLAAEVEGA
ncbi:MAG: hypothetical protein ACPF9W_05250, partial [Nocardioides sp.]